MVWTGTGRLRYLPLSHSDFLLPSLLARLAYDWVYIFIYFNRRTPPLASKYSCEGYSFGDVSRVFEVTPYYGLQPLAAVHRYTSLLIASAFNKAIWNVTLEAD